MKFKNADLSRVCVVGTTCSGKPTFAQDLAQALEVSHIELDALYWTENWTPAPRTSSGLSFSS